MGDKIVKSKNLCCQPVVFPSLSLLKEWGREVFNGVAGMIKRCKNTNFEYSNFINDNFDR